MSEFVSGLTIVELPSEPQPTRDIAGLSGWLPQPTEGAMFTVPSRPPVTPEETAAIDASLRETEARLSRMVATSLYGVDRDPVTGLFWQDNQQVIIRHVPWHRRALTWLDAAWERCLGAVGLCRISRRHEHDEAYDD